MKVTRLENPKADWIRVLNAARRTWGKKPINKEPSVSFKKELLLAEHSPIRLLEYDFTWEDIQQWVTAHFVRHHEGCEKFEDHRASSAILSAGGRSQRMYPLGCGICPGGL